MSRIFLPVIITLILVFFGVSLGRCEGDFFSKKENRDMLAKELSGSIEKAWKKWQNTVLINGIKVEGSYGRLTAGSMGRSAFIFPRTEKAPADTGKPRQYYELLISSMRSLENGMRSWQRGYTCENIVFPEGASCSYTLSPCDNIPVSVATGYSSGDRDMSEEGLYSYIVYHLQDISGSDRSFSRAIAMAISECFTKWKKECLISGIIASGGIAPHPGPMGGGTGPVRGAMGNNGILKGPYISAEELYAKMVEYSDKAKDSVAGHRQPVASKVNSR